MAQSRSRFYGHERLARCTSSRHPGLVLPLSPGFAKITSDAMYCDCDWWLACVSRCDWDEHFFVSYAASVVRVRSHVISMPTVCSSLWHESTRDVVSSGAIKHLKGILRSLYPLIRVIVRLLWTIAEDWLFSRTRKAVVPEQVDQIYSQNSTKSIGWFVSYCDVRDEILGSSRDERKRKHLHKTVFINQERKFEILQAIGYVLVVQSRMFNLMNLWIINSKEMSRFAKGFQKELFL